MIQNKFGELIFSEKDLADLVMRGHDLATFSNAIVDNSIDMELWPNTIDPMPKFVLQKNHTCTVVDFHAQQQKNWRMPDQYKTLDIAEYVLSLCKSQQELQRCGQELLLYQEKNLFDLLRYLKYLVDTMATNNIIWGVGRGSSVASYVLYKIGVHRIDSMYYNLDIGEFLR
jgi:DNA polymerase III alpha subunit